MNVVNRKISEIKPYEKNAKIHLCSNDGVLVV